jgi:hypothetical protein
MRGKKPMKPTLDYWKAKSELTQRLFIEQLQDSDKQDEAFKNLARFMEAENQIMMIQREASDE